MSEAPAQDAPRNLLRVLGLVFGLAVVVGSVIGSGIMRAPGVVALGITSAPLILLVCLSAIRLRMAEPQLPRPWRMPLFPWIAIGAALIQAGLIGLVVWDDPGSGVASAIVAFAPLPIYLLFAKTWRRQAGLL